LLRGFPDLGLGFRRILPLWRSRINIHSNCSRRKPGSKIKLQKDLIVNKLLNKWFRKFHRWLVLPFTALLLTVIFARGTILGDTVQRVQAVLMIIMAITGLYLYLLPYWVKWQRQRVRAK
jgi:hypothetical protein